MGTDFPTGGRSGSGVGGAGGTGSCQLHVSTAVPNFIWGALAWLEVKKGSLQFMALVGVRSQTIGDGGAGAVRVKSLIRTMWSIEESQKKHQEI